MAPNSRPPLTSRIRASFEGRRKSFDGTRKLSKSGRTTTSDSNNVSQEGRVSTNIDSDIYSPLHTNGFITQDPESIRNAVDLAINGEAFQNAIAANLAKLIKPSIKSALDTIQPVVEAVYSHELLLRKTNQSVEDVLSRMDTNAETAAARRGSTVDTTYIAPGSPADGEKSSDAGDEGATSKGLDGPDFNQFRQMLEDHNAKTLATIIECTESSNTKMEELSQGFSDVSASIGPTKESIDSLKSTSEQATTTFSVLQAQLDQLKADIGQIIEAIGTDLGKNIQSISEKSGAAPDVELLSSHTTKLDQITTDLAALKGHEETTEKIDAISSELGVLKASVEAGNTANAQGFTDVLAAVGDHATVLNEIKDKEPHPEILAALQQSNDSHVLHTAALSEIKEQSLGAAPAPVVSEGGSVDHSTALQIIQTDLTALKENIAAGFLANGDLGAKIDTVLTTIEEQKAQAPNIEILAAVKQSNESHLAHATALEGLKSGGAELGPELGTQITGIVSKLDEHSAALEDIKAFGGTHTAALEGIKSVPSENAAVDTNELAAQIAAVIAKLETHTTVLEEIKGAGSTPVESTPLDTGDLTAQISTIATKLDTHEAKLDEIKDLGSTHATALESHGGVLESIKSAPADNVSGASDSFATQVAALEAKLDSHTAALDEIKGLSGSHATALEGIKSAGPESTPTESSGDLSAQVAALEAKLDSHTTALDEIKGLSGSHATALEGIKSAGPESTPTESSGDLSAQVAALEAKLDSHTAALDEIKGLSGSHATALEGIKSAGPESTPTESSGDLSAQVAALEAKLDSHTAALDEIKGLSGSHATALEGIKSVSPEPTPTEEPGDLSAQISTIVNKLDEHTSVLNELKSFSSSHVTALEGIKSISPEPAETEGSGDLSTQISAIASKLDEHASVLNEIKGFGGSHATALENHGTALESIKSLSVSVPGDTKDSEIASQITAVVTTLENHSAALDEIKAHTTTLPSHASLLEEIKTSTGTHTTALESHGAVIEGIKSLGVEPSAEGSTSASETQISAIIATLERHGSSLDEIKTSTGAHTAALESQGSALEEIKTSTGAHITALESHGTAIESIKSLGAGPSAEPNNTAPEQISAIIATLEDQGTALNEIKTSTGTHATALESHGSTLESLKDLITSLPSEGNDAPALESKIGAIISTLESHSVALDEIKATGGSHTSVLDEIKSSSTTHATALESHGISIEEIKTRSLGQAPTAGESDPLETQMTNLIATLESHTAALDEIKASTGSHTLVLDELKIASTTYADALEDLKSPIIPPIAAADPGNLAALEIQVGSIISTLETHSAAWNEIRARDSTSTAVVLNDSANDSETSDGPFTSIIDTLKVHTHLLNEIKEDVSAEILTALHDMGQVQANQSNLLTEIREADLDDEILTLLHASSESHTSHASALDKIHAAVLVSNEHHTTHNVLLDEIKSRSVDAAIPSGEAPDIGGLKEKIGDIAGKLDEYSATLSAIKDATDASNLSHVAHTTSLAEIQSKSANAPTENGSLDGLESQIGGIVSKLDDHTTALSSIKDMTSQSNVSHLAHAVVLAEIKDKTASLSDYHASNSTVLNEIKATALETKDLHSMHATSLLGLKDVTSSFHDNHTVTLSEIRDATLACKDAHASHTAAFTELKSIQPTVALAPAAVDLSGLESNIASMLTTLEGQTAILSSIKEGTAQPSHEVLAAIQASHDLLTTHGPLLESIQKSTTTSNTDILSNISELKAILEDSKAETASHGALVKDLHSETKDSHSNLVSAIGALALGGAAGAGATALLSKDEDSNSGVLNEVKAVRKLLETSATNVEETKEKVSSLASQIESNHAAIITSVSTLVDDIKSEIDASSTGVVESISALHGDVKAIDVSSLPALSTSLTQHGTDLKDISNQIETLEGSVKENITHTTTLHNGVHFNETGVQQLKDHIIIPQSAPPMAKEQIAMAEGAWFGSARSGSRSPALSRVVSRSHQPIPEAVEQVSPSTEDANVGHKQDSEPEIFAEEQVVSREIDDTPVVERTVEADSIVEPLVVDGDTPEPLSEIIQEPVLKSEAVVDNSVALKDIEEIDNTLASPQVDEVTAFNPVQEEVLVIESTNVESAEKPASPLDPVMENSVVDDLEQSTEVAVSEMKDDQALIDPNIKEAATAVESHEFGHSPEAEESTLEKPIGIEQERSLVAEPIGSESPVEAHVKGISVDAMTRTEDAADIAEKQVGSNVLADKSSVHEDDIPVQGNLDSDESERDQGGVPEAIHEDVHFASPIDIRPETYHIDEDEADLPVAMVSSPDLAYRNDETAPLSRAVEHGSLPDTQDARWPLFSHEIPEASSPFVESPPIPRNLDEHFANSPALLHPAHQNFLGDQGLDSGHATPRDEARSNPFEDSDNMMSPSSVFSPQSVLSPEVEINAPVFPVQERMDSIDERGFASEDPVSFAPPPTFPIFPGTSESIAQRHTDEWAGVASPSSEYDAPAFSDVRPRTPVYTDEREATFTPQPRLPAFPDLSPRTPVQALDHDNLSSPDTDRFAPPPTFPTFPAASQYTAQRFDDSDDVISPSSEYDDPVSSNTRQHTAFQSQPFDSPAFTPAPPRPVFPEPTQHTSQQRYEDSDDDMTPASQYDAHGLPHMTQESPFQSRPFETSHIPSSPQFDRQSTFQPRGLQHEGSFDYEQENYEPALLPRNLGGETRAFEAENSQSPSHGGFTDPDVRHRSPLQPLEDDDLRAGQYERYSPEPANYRQGSPVEAQYFNGENIIDPGFPAVRQRSAPQHVESYDYESPPHQRYSPEPANYPQGSPVEAQYLDNRNTIDPGFPAARQRSPPQHVESYDYQSPPHQRYSPEPESSFLGHQQGSPVDTRHFNDHSQRETAFPSTRRASPMDSFEDEIYPSRSHQQYSPEPEPLFAAQRQHSRENTPPAIGTLPAHLQLNTPAFRSASPIDPYDERPLPSHQRYSPEPEALFTGQRQDSRETTPPAIRNLPAHLQLNTPAFRSASPIDPYDERDAEIVSPSSEFAVPVTPALPTHAAVSTSRNPFLPGANFNVDDSPSRKGKAIASPGLMSPELGSPAEFGFNRNEVDSELDSALASPTSPTSLASPVFSEGGTMVSGGKKKKGKKEKKEKTGGKKAKKEKVPFEMDGEDAE